MRKLFLIVLLMVVFFVFPVSSQSTSSQTTIQTPQTSQKSIADGNCSDLSLKYWGSIIPEANVNTFQRAMNHYFMYNGTTCLNGQWNNDSWGEAPMSKMISYELAVRGYQLKDQLSQSQKSQFVEILKNELREDTFVKNDGCNVPGNSCSKDYMSFVAFLASARLFPEVGDEGDSLEKKYFNKSFSVEDGGVVWEEKQWDRDACEDLYMGCPPSFKTYSNGVESPIYAGELFVELGNALFPYKLTGQKLPIFYYDNTVIIKNLWFWMRSKTDVNGVFTRTCHDLDGNVFSCGNASCPNYPPPAGRVMTFLFGTHFVWLHASRYDFIDVSTSDTFVKFFWDIYNPSPTSIH